MENEIVRSEENAVKNEPKVGQSPSDQSMSDESSNGTGDSSSDSESSDDGSSSTETKSVAKNSPKVVESEPVAAIEQGHIKMETRITDHKATISAQSTPMVMKLEATTTPEFATPLAKSARKNDGKSKSISPEGVLNDNRVEPGQLQVPQSPIVVTPAKSMGPVDYQTPPGIQRDNGIVFKSPALTSRIEVKASSDGGKGRQSTAESPQGSGVKTMVTPVVIKTEPAVGQELSSAEKKQRRKRKKKEAKKKLDRRLAKELDKLVRKRKSRGSHAKSGKNKKAKVKDFESSSGSEGSTASPEAPTTSQRIKKITNGRKMQRLAISRAKQLGVICDGEIRQVEMLEGLKIVGSTKFDIQPTHAYPKYHYVSGTGLPHIQEHFAEFCVRYGIILRDTADLHLSLTRDLNYAKKAAVQPDLTNKYAKLWQLDNDIKRTDASSLEALQNADEEPAPVTIKVDKDGFKTPSKVECSKTSGAGSANNPDGARPQSAAKTSKKRKKSGKIESE